MISFLKINVNQLQKQAKMLGFTLKIRVQTDKSRRHEVFQPKGFPVF